MREVDFRHLKATLESLSASSDLVLANGWVKLTLSRQGSPYVSRRGVKYEQIAPVAPEGVIVAANYYRLLVVGPNQNAVQEATERGPRPFDDSLLGWDGPRAKWVVERVPAMLLRPVLETARTYGLVGREWMEVPLLYAAWLVPVVVAWDEDGHPVFDWPAQSTESEPVDQEDLPVEV